MTIYRGMKPDKLDRLPIVANKSWGLGVRTATDAKPDLPVVNGKVCPNTGGMSVHVDPFSLPGFVRPFALGGFSTTHEVYSLEEECLPASLMARQDKPMQDPTHRCVEPSMEMALEDYLAALVSTRSQWRIYVRS
jgi:hypothetical protein